MSLLTVTDDIPSWAEAVYNIGRLVKEADDTPTLAYNLAGMLYLSTNGWLMLSVPNAFVHGVFSMMKETGIEYPPSKTDGRLNAHMTVMRPEELAQIGGADRVTERGKQFHFTFGRLYSVEPAGWPEMSRVWFVRVHSPELMELRRSYGLSSLPKEGKFDFHITVAVRRRGVLGRNETSKA